MNWWQPSVALSPPGAWGPGTEIYMDLTITYSFDVFLSVIFYCIMLPADCKIGFIPNKVIFFLSLK